MPDKEIRKLNDESRKPDKNPEQEGEHPAPMPRNQQGQGGAVPDRDPAGRQGGYHE